MMNRRTNAGHTVFASVSDRHRVIEIEGKRDRKGSKKEGKEVGGERGGGGGGGENVSEKQEY